MLSNFTIKQEPEEQNTVSTSTLNPEVTTSSQTTAFIELLNTKILELEKQLSSVAAMHNENQSAIVGLKEQFCDLKTKNIELEQELAAEKSRNQQLEEKLTRGLQEEATARSALTSKLSESLKNQTAELTSDIKTKQVDFKREVDTIQASLTTLKQDLKQEISDRQKREKKWLDEYTKHKHKIIQGPNGALSLSIQATKASGSSNVEVDTSVQQNSNASLDDLINIEARKCNAAEAEQQAYTAALAAREPNPAGFSPANCDHARQLIFTADILKTSVVIENAEQADYIVQAGKAAMVASVVKDTPSIQLIATRDQQAGNIIRQRFCPC